MSGLPVLFVGDSHQKALQPRLVESLLCVHLVSGAESSNFRGYCSTPDWPGARFPWASLSDRVRKLVMEKQFKILIVQAPCNDISNLLKNNTKNQS